MSVLRDTETDEIRELVPTNPIWKAGLALAVLSAFTGFVVAMILGPQVQSAEGLRLHPLSLAGHGIFLCGMVTMVVEIFIIWRFEPFGIAPGSITIANDAVSRALHLSDRNPNDRSSAIFEARDLFFHCIESRLYWMAPFAIAIPIFIGMPAWKAASLLPDGETPSITFGNSGIPLGIFEGIFLAVCLIAALHLWQSGWDNWAQAFSKQSSVSTPPAPPTVIDAEAIPPEGDGSQESLVEAEVAHPATAARDSYVEQLAKLKNRRPR